jgi:hypothetical protein
MVKGRIGVESEHCTNEFSNYRILTPPLHAFPVPHGEIPRPANYPFLTPRKKDSEFRIQSGLSGSSLNIAQTNFPTTGF